MAGRPDRLIPRRTRLPHYRADGATLDPRTRDNALRRARDTQKYERRSLVTSRAHYIKTHFTCTHYARNSLRLLSHSRPPRRSLSSAISDCHFVRSISLDMSSRMPGRYASHIRYPFHFLFLRASLYAVISVESTKC